MKISKDNRCSIYIKNLIKLMLPIPQAKDCAGQMFENDNWELSRFAIRKLLLIAGCRPFPVSELMLMSGAVIWLKPDYIFEWGTHIGKSARIFYESAKKFRINCQIHSIDLPDDAEHEEHPHSKRGLLVRGLKNVQLHQGDGIDTAKKIIDSLPVSPKQPLFFIDGDHSYGSVKRELGYIIEQWPKAAILLHDTFFQTSESGYNIGPWQAIQELTAGKGYKSVSINTGLPGMTLLYK